ncbi:MAG: PLP-dependent transferase [Pirellulales bacterium]
MWSGHRRLPNCSSASRPRIRTCSVVDLERFAEVGRRHGAETLIDATTPVTPLNLGVLSNTASTTQVAFRHQQFRRSQRPPGGSVAGSTEKLRKNVRTCGISGAVCPNSAYLLLRGLKTFPLRMQRCAQVYRRLWRGFLMSIPRSNTFSTPGSSLIAITIARRTMTGLAA